MQSLHAKADLRNGTHNQLACSTQSLAPASGSIRQLRKHMGRIALRWEIHTIAQRCRAWRAALVSLAGTCVRPITVTRHSARPSKKSASTSLLACPWQSSKMQLEPPPVTAFLSTQVRPPDSCTRAEGRHCIVLFHATNGRPLPRCCQHNPVQGRATGIKHLGLMPAMPFRKQGRRSYL